MRIILFLLSFAVFYLTLYLCDTIGAGRAVVFMLLLVTTLFLLALCVMLHNINKD